IRVIKPLVGGGFGGKSEVIPLEIIAAVAARKAKAPVKITYTREEVFWAHRGRPRTIIDLKTGIKSDGRITAVAAKVIQDGGAYCSYGVVTILYSGALLGALYDIPNIRYDGYRVLTNKPACGAMRGQFHHPLRHAALHREHQDRPRRRRGGVHRRQRDRAGLRHHGGADRCRRPGLQAGTRESHRCRYRPDAD